MLMHIENIRTQALIGIYEEEKQKRPQIIYRRTEPPSKKR